MSKDKFKEEEKRIATELMKKSKEQIIELYLQVKFERDYLQGQYESKQEIAELRQELLLYAQKIGEKNKEIMELRSELIVCKMKGGKYE